MQLPHETRVLPGHTDETTIGREWEENPFVRVWRGVEPEGSERAASGGGRDARRLVARLRRQGQGGGFDDDRDAIVGGSRVERG